MAKNEATLARLTDMPEILVLPDGAWTLPQLGQLAALPADAVGNGKLGEHNGAMELASINRVFKLVDAKNPDGSPMLISATITFKRTPISDDEIDRVTRAVEANDKRGTAAKLRKAAEKQEHADVLLGAFRQGVSEASAAAPKPKDTVEALKEAVAVAGILASFAPKQITSGS